jgi:phosphopantetheine adenylyltransferase
VLAHLKPPFFTLDDRLAMLREVLDNAASRWMPEGLLVDMRTHRATVVVRRAGAADLDYERQTA